MIFINPFCFGDLCLHVVVLFLQDSCVEKNVAEKQEPGCWLGLGFLGCAFTTFNSAFGY